MVIYSFIAIYTLKLIFKHCFPFRFFLAYIFMPRRDQKSTECTLLVAVVALIQLYIIPHVAQLALLPH